MFVDGILSGRLSISDSPHHPQLRGTAHLINGRLLGGASLSTALTFEGQTATIDFARVAQTNVRHASALTAARCTARGEIDFRDLTDIRVEILPNEPLIALTLLGAGRLRRWHRAFTQWRRRIREDSGSTNFVFAAAFLTPNWTISLSERHADDPLAMLLQTGSSRTFPLCHDLQPAGKTLMLGTARLLFP